MRVPIAENRNKLKPIMKTVVLCGKQNIPLHAHRHVSQYKVDQTITFKHF